MAQNYKRYQKAVKAGHIYNERGEWEKAMRVYRAAIDEFPQKPDPYAGLGEACLGLKQLGRALECFKLAARYSKGDISYLEKVADIQERQGMLREAGRTYMAIGEMYLKSRRLDEAVGTWQRAIRLEANLLGAHKRLAMVYQRQQKMKDAVRSYLAIARILQMRGENKKALRMCEAALRLDPKNEDVLMAVELIQKGEEGYKDPEVEEIVTDAPKTAVSDTEQAEADKLTATIRQMAAVFESERQEQHIPQTNNNKDPIETARRLAQEHLAEELFRDEDDDENGDSSLSKLERDALIGQGMDLESRGQIEEAIQCYEKAIDGGLKLPAAHFTLGMLFMDVDKSEKAREYFQLAMSDSNYANAIQVLVA
ncbi:MAG: tetratricopeptide repeat protein [Chloroflexi bacterium]|nr:tetratricopeptide repeat protein [Chloroflexota bacterium]